MKIRNTISLILCLVLIVSMNILSAKADSMATDNKDFISASEASEQMIQLLECEGVQLNNSSRISIENVADVVSGIIGNALVVRTMLDDITVQTDYIFNIDGNGNIAKIPSEPMTRGSQTWNFTSDPNGYLTIHATTVDNVYSGYYYQPQSASFYYNKLKTCSVTWIQVIYSCAGVKYSYPGFVYQGTTDSHHIYITRSNPSPNLTNTTYYAYSSSYCMDISSGLGSGRTVSFNYTVNGTTRYYIL